jgi:hypothetical protein
MENNDLFTQYTNSQAPKNGVKFEDYKVILEMEKNRSISHLTMNVTPGGYYFISYTGYSANFPQRSFKRLKDAKKYFWMIKLYHPDC